MLRIAGGSVNQIPLDWKNNTQNIIGAIELAKKNNVDILCLPELCITGYGCEDLFLSDWLHEKAWEELLTIVPHCNDIAVCIGLPLKIDALVYNGACFVVNGKILGITCKQKLARDGVHYEPRWFNPWIPKRVVEIKRGHDTVRVGDIMHTVKDIRIGFEICEDGWQKDRPGQSLYERGVDLILNPSASHFAIGKSQLREEIVVLEASRRFKCVYVFANLLGNEAGRMIYDGDIIIAQHDKVVLQDKRLSFDRYKVRYSDIDFHDPTKSPQSEILDDKDRNEELTQAISLGLYDYLRKSKAKGFVLSLSGGADSGACAVLVAEMVRRSVKALGFTTVCRDMGIDETVNDEKQIVSHLLTTAYQATKNSSKVTFDAAKELASSIGATFFHWNLDEEVASYTSKIEKALGRSLTWDDDDISLQNIQARTRSPIIWMLANVKASILLTTSNRSEADVGYATMDGDTSGSLAPIAGLSKIFILQWLKWAEENLKYQSLQKINSLQPTAELKPPDRHQTDEGDLMPYTVLAEIEMHAIRDRKSPRQVFDAMKDASTDHDQLKAYIKKFFHLWSINQWKRERFAPSFHLDDLNVDPRTWCRFPILSGGFKEELDTL